MANQKILAIGIVMLAIGTVCAFASGRNEATGDITTVEAAVSSFETVQVRNSAHVRVHTAPEYRVTVSAEPNLHKRIKIKIKNNELVVRVQGRTKSFPPFTVDLYCPSLAAVSAAGNTTIELIDPVITEKFLVNLTGDGSVTGTLECETFTLSMHGSARAALAGKAESAVINLVGNSIFDGKELQVIHTTMNFTGSVTFNTWTTGTLITQGVGDVTVAYRGDPALEMKGGGQVKFTKLP